MGLSASIASAIAAAKGATSDVLGEVIHLPATGTDGYAVTYGSPVTRVALVEDGQAERGGEGTEQISIAKITFLEPVAITANDRFTLPNGTVGEVLRHYALLDTAGNPFMTEAWLGAAGANQ